MRAPWPRSEQRRATLLRVFNPQNTAHARDRRELESRIAETEARVARLRRQRGDLEAGLKESLSAFWPLTDPRDGVVELDDRYPVLLFPLRIETRFKQTYRSSGYSDVDNKALTWQRRGNEWFIVKESNR